MRNAITKSELDAYIRIDRVFCQPWFRTIGLISGLSFTGCRSYQVTKPVGGLAWLTTSAGKVICLHVAQQMEAGHCRASIPLLLFASGGDISISSSDGAWQSLSVPTWVRSGDEFDLRLAENSRLIVLKPTLELAETNLLAGTYQQLPAIAPLIKRYLQSTRFYIDDAHAKALTRELFGQLAKLQAGGQITEVLDTSPPDRRLQRAIDKIEQNPNWEFNLQELASYSGASERNLYYLMKRSTGLTPYRFYQRQRLIRVRRRLVDCQAREPHISRYAADEGFSHLGRFAALYREHFGELPSKTVRCRQHLYEADMNAGELTCEMLTQR
ncbi:MAG: AraC-like DNA-binding protein [Marinobacter maritimus]|jgi:AraC-like DNA-binding protein|uniref:helix-turn-helix domain-containing protein n=1 Tax=Marinobacter maritimus TaxID=277961 RepID=UPI0011A4F85E|nr:AraC family transcriptional regulator [Marinobacter maritimus]|tara:strand:+ start:219 stop:1199 length:981 start_codon:yes stop_codon:yes gene_type:complete